MDGKIIWEVGRGKARALHFFRNGLRNRFYERKIFVMSDRKIGLELIERLPEDVDVRDIARELEFVAGVKEGFRELEAGQGVEAEQVRGMVAAWATR